MQWAAGRQPWQPWLATLVANRRCYRENVYRSNRSHRPPRQTSAGIMMKHATHLSVHTPHSPPHSSSSRSYTLSKRFLCLPYPYTSACPIGFSFWHMVSGQDPREQVSDQTGFCSCSRVQSSGPDRTGLAKRPPTVAASHREAYTFHWCCWCERGKKGLAGRWGCIVSGTRQCELELFEY